MKGTIILIFLILCFTNTKSHSKWTISDLGYHIAFNKVYFVNPNTGWILTNSGILLKTTDQGENWEEIDFNENITFISISFSDNNNGWLIGYRQDGNSNLYKTTNEGADWKLIKIFSEFIVSIYFIDSQTGWATGLSSSIYYSNNGGNSWLAQNSQTSSYLISSEFLTSTLGWIIGVGVIIKTTDGGNIWINQNSPVLNKGLNSIDMLDSLTGWICAGDGSILKTTDSGENWLRQEKIFDRRLVSIFFFDNQNGWCVGDSGKILHTTNGGDSWSFQHNPDVNHLNSIFFINSDIGFCVGLNGTFLKTTNGGYTSIEDYVIIENKFISIFPNPAGEYIEISRLNKGLQPLVQDSEIRIYNVLGECVMSVGESGGTHPLIPSQEGNLRIDVSGLPAGVYFVRVGEWMGKFVLGW